MKRANPALKLPGDGRPWIGANFWSASGGPLMWSNYDPELVRRELTVLADHGLNVTRSFFYWPDFMPTPDELAPEPMRHFADFLDAHSEAGMTTIPTFLVGHMSGENWDPAWRGGRDLYSDIWFVGRQAWYIRTLVERFGSHPAVAAWLLTNEVPIYGGEGDQEVITAWAEILIDAVRAAGGTQPVSVGDGAWGVEVTGKDTGFSIRALAQAVDFVGPHVYQMESDQIRQHLKAAFVCELAACTGQPVVMEEFGLTTDFVSPAGAASYYRQLLINTLMAGSTGWIAWNNTDYDYQIAQRPYSHHPFEMHFGITTADGEPKPPLLELAKFRRTLDTIDLPNCRRGDADAALVIPSYIGARYQFTSRDEQDSTVRNCEQAYTVAKEAHLPVAVVREEPDGGLPEGAKLYLLPSVKQLTGPSWRQLQGLARAGATVYASYFVGDIPVQRGPWWAYPEELFGVQRELAYGLADPVEDDVVEMTFTEDFGSIAAGETLSFKAAGTPDGRTFLPVSVLDGRVVARDAHGRPAIVVKEHGSGRAVLSTYPIEYFASRLGRVNPEQTHRLYDALAQVAGVERPVRVDDPRVFIDRMDHADGRTFWLLVSQHAAPVTVKVESAVGLRTTDGEPVSAVEVEPYGVRVLVAG